MAPIKKKKKIRSIGNSSEDSLCKFIVVPVTGLKCHLHMLLKLISYFVTYIHYIVNISMDSVNMTEGKFV